MRIAFTTLGCKLNQVETNVMQEACRGSLMEVVPFEAEADVYVVNTCSVTGKTDRAARQLVRRAVAQNPQAAVVVTGCYAQLQPEAVSALPGVRLVLGNEEKHDLLHYLGSLEVNGAGTRIAVGEIGRSAAFRSAPLREFVGYTKAFVKIQTGCDYRCTFCSIWTARGPSRSETPERILAQMAELARSGVREMAFTGVCVGSYGLDLAPSTTLAALVRRAEAVEGLERLRITSIEPTELTDELLETMATSPIVCPHLHVPLQSGSDRVLEAMDRNYHAAFYRGRVEAAARLMPGAGIGADVMVGFPGETDDDFETTAALLEALPVTYLHVFSFSARPGAPAAERPDQVDLEVKKARSKRLRDLGEAKRRAFMAAQVGRTVPVLIETTRDRTTGRLKGWSDTYVKVHLEGPNAWMGRVMPVDVTAQVDGHLEGVGVGQGA
ncbi:MAG: tRNA (N(6)-L-threonylcarbamoyladenosine(37)-C(2))-methylthiotransferase MtaB [Nitrospinota bacterium]